MDMRANPWFFLFSSKGVGEEMPPDLSFYTWFNVWTFFPYNTCAMKEHVKRCAPLDQPMPHETLWAAQHLFSKGKQTKLHSNHSVSSCTLPWTSLSNTEFFAQPWKDKLQELFDQETNINSVRPENSAFWQQLSRWIRCFLLCLSLSVSLLHSISVFLSFSVSSFLSFSLPRCLFLTHTISYLFFVSLCLSHPISLSLSLTHLTPSFSPSLP